VGLTGQTGQIKPANFGCEQLCLSIMTAVKQFEAQQTKMPLEAPTEGQKSKQSNCFGAKLRINCISMVSLLVSCRETILALLSSIF
jgi:hypothetical protein